MSISPPRPKSPPLNALRAFETVARLGSIRLAAGELCVTPAAVSLQVKSLEEWAGQDLLIRRPNGIKVTTTGTSIAAELERALDIIGHVSHKLRQTSPSAQINIATLPSIALLWLSPRLPALRAAIAPHAISVSAVETPPNLLREAFDCSLFYREPTGAKNEIILSQDIIFPVCSSRVASTLHGIADIASAPLLYDSTWDQDWDDWRRIAAPNIGLHDGARFSLYSMAVAEAINDAGLVMGHLDLIADALRAGTLVEPFSTRHKTGKALILEIAMPRIDDPALQRIVKELI